MGGVQGESGGSGEEEEEVEEGGQADRSGHLVLRSGVSLSLGGEKRATLYSRELTRATLAGNFHRSRAPLPIFFSLFPPPPPHVSEYARITARRYSPIVRQAFFPFFLP